MKYFEQYLQLKDLFDLNKDEIVLPGNRIVIRNFDFNSSPVMPVVFNGIREDLLIHENNCFRYPVFFPEGLSKGSEVIIYLHGLNERTWYKHLAGAKHLAETTGKAVLMFPLSYHINRGLPEWSDTRKMAGLLEVRKRNYPGIRESSIANLALSDRLTKYPQRFFLSGLQSAVDLINLLRQIKGGHHSFFNPGTVIDFFAYSISCLLLQTLMVSNAGDMLKRSKIIFFAGGALFNHLQGTSRYIMDSVAFETIKKFYGSVYDNRSLSSDDTAFQYEMMESNFGRAFRTVLAPDIRKKERERHMSDFNDNLMVIALQKDKIIPLEGIRLAMGEKLMHSKRFKILHFPYAYSHENPFPVLYRKIEGQVEQAFRWVYDMAAQFFNADNTIFLRNHCINRQTYLSCNG
ncbi:MAG: hypothetical protein JXR41_07230 [Bacteroidales bacterium]|nr:hypothetical protein [Bacteroidales bacterium]MBN2762864.1 hypothetical protein [Bacteroidales bacterium]